MADGPRSPSGTPAVPPPDPVVAAAEAVSGRRPDRTPGPCCGDPAVAAAEAVSNRDAGQAEPASPAAVASDVPLSSLDARPAPLPDLIPVRMLNEFTYCPRLGYLEWVQGEWAENLETLEGTFGHRNVDKPSRGEVPPPEPAKPPEPDEPDEPAEPDGNRQKSEQAAPDSPLHARSLMLSAPGEGLIAKLDLLELDGDRATPVDYKRGTIPDVPEGAYEPERVQLCAQGLVLRENGYESHEGVIYFVGSRRRVTIAFDEALVARTRELIADFRRTAAEGRLPPPLEDSPKCPRCSLVGICLPDEVNLLRSAVPADDAEPETEDREPPSRNGLRRLIPARDDALPLYLQDHGLSLGKKGEQLVVKKKGATVRTVRLIDVSQVCVFGSAHVTEPALRELATRGVPVCHFSYGGWFYALTAGLVHKNVELRIRQFAAAGDPARALPLARRFIVGKIKNCRTLLRRHLQSDERNRLLWQLAEYTKKAEQAASLESLLGIEGTAAKVYFSGFARLLKGGGDFQIEGRNRRPPRDPVNTLLSFLYALLVKELTVALQAVGFDPMLGVYHQPRYGRPSLALDLAEEFRPLLADSTVLMLVNNGEVSPSSFISRAGSVALTDAGRRAVLSAFERRLSSEITHPLFGYRATYRRILEVQSRLLARTLLDELPEYPNFCTR